MERTVDHLLSLMDKVGPLNTAQADTKRELLSYLMKTKEKEIERNGTIFSVVKPVRPAQINPKNLKEWYKEFMLDRETFDIDQFLDFVKSYRKENAKPLPEKLKISKQKSK